MTDEQSMSTDTSSESAEQPEDGQDIPERLKTVYSEVDLRCPRCRAQWSPAVAIFVNFGTDPMGREGILRKSMHHAFCPACKYHLEVDHIFAVYIPEENAVVQVRMPWEFKAGGGEEVYWKRLEDLVMKYADLDVKVDVVFGFDELIDKYLGGEEASAAAIARAQEEKQAGLRPGALAPGVEAPTSTA
jgi:hypothetical protein